MSGSKKNRVVVGLSGGVDSAVAALLLKQAGNDVHGLFMHNWDDEEGYCTSAEDFQDARQVAEHLDIPLHRVDFSREYRERIFQLFLDEYAAGRTPNPDILCNREIKFGEFVTYARRLGANRIATGHYAQLKPDGNRTRLMIPTDRDKDQTYFLHAVPRDALALAEFPLGGLEKSQVRSIARVNGLRNYARKDSTGICFIGERDFRRFLEQYLPARPGPIVTIDGAKIGNHDGLMYYTIGQRQGLRLGGRSDRPDAPWYVAEKNLASNELLVVQGHDHPALLSDALTAEKTTWLQPDEITLPAACHARIRHRQPLQSCQIFQAVGDNVRVEFSTAQRAVAPGQYVVFYRAGECIGGGVISGKEPSGTNTNENMPKVADAVSS